ncbi:MAG: Gfo/Idh/MocA family oxidoreductase [Candidatus Peribacteraceae bacterium]|nr:Gfo/Idh/MocA family oxidoreductase [Candidatus Peribacteraceae bacterium]
MKPFSRKPDSHKSKIVKEKLMLHFPPECTVIPPRIPACIVGLGPGGFIGPTAHGPNLLASNMFDIRWAGTEPNTDFHVNVAKNLRLPQENVSSDLAALFRRMVLQSQAKDVSLPPIVDICTPTHLHAAQIKLAVESGVRHIMTDKPAVGEIAEIHQVREVLKQTGAKLWVTFNHRYNFVVAWLRAYVAKHPKRIASIDAGFLQDWLIKEVHFRQADWRTAHKYCALLDILTHAADLASYVAGAPITSVEGARVEASRWAEFFDAGYGRLMFGNNIGGSAQCSQSSKGHADDIYVCVTETDGRRLMWRMEWNPDALFVSQTPDIENRSMFSQRLRGHSSFFAEALGDEKLATELAQQYGKNPPGHIQGWVTLWYFLFLGIAGAYCRDLQLPCIPFLPKAMQIEPPTFEDAGVQATACVHAYAKSAENGGKRVTLAEVLSA